MFTRLKADMTSSPFVLPSTAVACLLAISLYHLPSKAQISVPAKPTVIAAATSADFQTELLRLTNAERKKAGLAPLKLSSLLNQAAQSHVQDMVQKQFFSHTGSNGSSVADRVKAVGYKYSSVGENIAAGNATASSTVQQWMKSPGHRANILNRNYKEIGFGYAKSKDQYGHYWVQVFGSSR